MERMQIACQKNKNNNLYSIIYLEINIICEAQEA